MCARVGIADTCARVATLDMYARPHMYAIVCQASYMCQCGYFFRASLSNSNLSTSLSFSNLPTSLSSSSHQMGSSGHSRGGVGEATRSLPRCASCCKRKRYVRVCACVCVWERQRQSKSERMMTMKSDRISPLTTSNLSCTASHLSLHLTSHLIQALLHRT